jgi:hypothetical protein
MTEGKELCLRTQTVRVLGVEVLAAEEQMQHLEVVRRRMEVMGYLQALLGLLLQEVVAAVVAYS